MSLESAQKFVNDMREDPSMRQLASNTASGHELAAFIERRGYAFEIHHLVLAMAACMDELASCDGSATQPNT